MPDSFAHLHVHTEYSMLDGAARVDDLFAEAARMGMPALAMTDHGFLFGAVDFYQAGKKHGVKPILGVEGYLAPGSRFEKQRRDAAEPYTHLSDNPSAVITAHSATWTDIAWRIPMVLFLVWILNYTLR